MNESRQTRGAAAAGASTSSSPGGVAEQNVAGAGDAAALSHKEKRPEITVTHRVKEDHSG